MAIVNVSALSGLWTRSLLVLPNGGRDETTNVAWAQGPSLYADLRQPAGRPDFSHVSGLADLTMADCAWLATQQGFAGVLRQEGAFFEWVRLLDFQPPAGPDAGRLFWEGETLVETGRYADYREHWHRNESMPRQPCGAAHLTAADGRPGMLVWLGGGEFMLARGRRPAQHPGGASLAEAVAGSATLQAAQVLLDCEISQGRITNGLWRITRSTLPFRENTILTVVFAGDGLVQLNGTAWKILALEGDLPLH